MDVIKEFLSDNRDALVEFTKRLVSTPSPNLPGDERAVVDVILAELDELGLSEFVEVVGKSPERPNVLVRLNGFASGPTVMLCGHSDTKPVGDSNKWETNPYKPVVRDGKMYGLGTTDMKGAVAAAVYAAAALSKYRSQLNGNLLLVINSDEERTMEFGSGFLSREFAIQADIGLIGEPSGIVGPEFEFLHVVSRGISCFTVRVFWTQMHSSLTDMLR